MSPSLTHVPFLDRALHPWRHRRAGRRIQSLLPLREIVFLCEGNACRSPYAEAAFRSLLAKGPPSGSPVAIRSVGFLSPGRPPPPLATREARARGVEIGSHRSSTFLARSVATADLILVMTTRQKWRLAWNHGLRRVEHLGDLDPGPIPQRDILDPMGEHADAFQQAYERIDRSLETLAEWMEGAGPSHAP